jgi:serine O-acetyltransferase
MATATDTMTSNPSLWDLLQEDIGTVFDKDPAARSTWEILTCYPGLHAIWLHRLAHWFWNQEWLWLARFISHLNRWLTGIEIHPGAQIGRRFFIDHGMGVVIGETAEIGDDVLMYKGVVLGGTSLERRKRHPTIEDDVVIGSNASVLGAITVGAGAKIGSGAVVINEVSAGATVVGVPGRVVRGPGAEKGQARIDLEHADLPDPVAEAIRVLLDDVEELEDRLYRIEDTCSQLEFWHEEVQHAPRESHRHIRADWLDASCPATQDTDYEDSDHMGQIGRAQPGR